MFELFASLTLLGMGAVFGMALAALVIVQPLLLKISRETAIEVFKPFFFRTHYTVLSLSIAVTLFALVTSLASGNWWWFGVAMVMHLNGPYTYFMMMPTNRRLLADDVDPHNEQTTHDLQRWRGLHAVRVVINGIVFLGFIIIAVYIM